MIPAVAMHNHSGAPSLPPALADITGFLLRRAYLRVLEVVGDQLAPGRRPAISPS